MRMNKPGFKHICKSIITKLCLSVFVLICLTIVSSKSFAELKGPLVFLHTSMTDKGGLGFERITLGEYFKEIPLELSLKNQKSKVFYVNTNFSTIKDRALAFKKQIFSDAEIVDTIKKGKKINIIAHSMAGLDAIYMYESLGTSDYISSITTIATPHRGTPLADWAEDIAKNENLLYWILRVFGYDLNTKYFINDLKSKPSIQTNQIAVPLFSVACYAESEDRSLTPLLRYFHSKVASLSSKYGFSNPKNDGFVPLDSQIAGNVIAYEKLDHLTELNHFVLADKHNRAVKLYSTILDFLEKQGF